jgi:hypothetical protein
MTQEQDGEQPASSLFFEHVDENGKLRELSF